MVWDMQERRPVNTQRLDCPPGACGIAAGHLHAYCFATMLFFLGLMDLTLPSRLHPAQSGILSLAWLLPDTLLRY